MGNTNTLRCMAYAVNHIVVKQEDFKYTLHVKCIQSILNRFSCIAIIKLTLSKTNLYLSTMFASRSIATSIIESI